MFVVASGHVVLCCLSILILNDSCEAGLPSEKYRHPQGTSTSTTIALNLQRSTLKCATNVTKSIVRHYLLVVALIPWNGV